MKMKTRNLSCRRCGMTHVTTLIDTELPAAYFSQKDEYLCPLENVAELVGYPCDIVEVPQRQSKLDGMARATLYTQQEKDT